MDILPKLGRGHLQDMFVYKVSLSFKIYFFTKVVSFRIGEKMVDYFTLLKKVLLKPNITYHTGTDEMWKEFENKEGIIFPQDYKEIINYYGTGGIGKFLWFLTPFETDENVNYIYKMKVMSDAYRHSKLKFPEDFKHNIFPENKGLLPWGFTDNGDELYWETGNKFEDWKIIIYESRSSDYFEYEMSLCEFLYKLICGEIICNAFPNDIFMGIKKYTVGF